MNHTAAPASALEPSHQSVGKGSAAAAVVDTVQTLESKQRRPTPLSTAATPTTSNDIPTTNSTPLESPATVLHYSSSQPSPATLLHSLHIDNSDYSETDTSFTSVETADTVLSPVDDQDATSPLPRPSAAAMRKYHRHVSRSAMKRESVSQLPSIKDLKQRWSNGAKVEHRAGAGVGIRPSPLAAPLAEEDDAPRARQRQPWKEVKLSRVAPADARRQAGEIVGQICELWGIPRGNDPSTSTGAVVEPPAGVAQLLIDTARAVRRVRSLNLVVVPPGSRRVSAPQPRVHARFSTPSRPSSGPSQQMPRITSSARSDMAPQPDSSALVRRAAIDLLGQLRNLEERLRVGSQGSATPPGSDSSSIDETTTGNTSRRMSTVSYDDPVWSDEDDFNINEAAREAEMARSHAPWEERLVSEAREYRKVEGTAWAKEREPALNAVRRWVDVVEGVFGDATDRPTDIWVISDSGSDIERLHAFLTAHLAPEHVQLLPPPSDELLDRLSDGYLLVQAYNGGIAMSARPWGFIPPEDVHDTLESAGESGREWTFRRAGNLTCWAAALRLRYNIPISMPATNVNITPLTLPSEVKATKAAAFGALGRRRQLPALEFDPLVVAKRTDGWANMLRPVLSQWVNEAAREVKGERVELGVSRAQPADLGSTVAA